jgi:hypothetical protein
MTMTAAPAAGTSTPSFTPPTDPDDRRSLIPALGLREYWYPALPAGGVGWKKPAGRGPVYPLVRAGGGEPHPRGLLSLPAGRHPSGHRLGEEASQGDVIETITKWGLRRFLLLNRAYLHPRVPAPKYLPQVLI